MAWQIVLAITMRSSLHALVELCLKSPYERRATSRFAHCPSSPFTRDQHVSCRQAYFSSRDGLSGIHDRRAFTRMRLFVFTARGPGGAAQVRASRTDQQRRSGRRFIQAQEAYQASCTHPSLLHTIIAHASQVYFNVILPADTTDRSLGYLTDSEIGAAMDLMHSAYKGAGIYFDLVETNYHVNETWWNEASQWNEIELEMKGKLRQGGPSA